MTPFPDPQSDRKRLSFDELLAVVVALTSIGAIFFWSISQKNHGVDLPLLQPLTEQPTAAPTQPPAPLSTPSPATTATPIAPPVSASPLPTSTPPQPAPTPPSPQAAPFVAAVPVPVSPSPHPIASPSVAAASSAPPAGKPKQFGDVPGGFWAAAPIAALSAKGILDGFPDGKFYPNRPVTRVEFAEMLQKAFNEPAKREPLKFSDISKDDRALAAINQATQTGFLNGFPDGRFIPDRQIPRLQVLLALATGLNLRPKAPTSEILNRYRDAEQIPKYAIDRVAAATEAGLVINDSDPKTLNPNKVATRAEAAALVYEALKQAP